MSSEAGHRSEQPTSDGRGVSHPDSGQEHTSSAGVPSETLFMPLGVAMPHRIGQYTLKRIIGSGSFGTVYEAMQDHPRRPVALKVMKRLTGAPSASALRRFQFEAELLGRLRHPSIAQVYEAGTFDDGMGATPYFVLEYIPNAKPITTYANERELTIRQRLELFVRVCDAVYQANLQGIIHRDLKPANILVDSSGQPKVIDFGVARATDSDMVAASQQTNVGELVGTLAYMSPEQIDADPHDLDIRSDVYSLGVILFELLSGQLPHDVLGKPQLQVARMIKDTPPKRLGKLKPEFRGDLDTIVATALEKDRQWRYQNAEELGQNLRQFVEGRAIYVRKPTILSQVRAHGRSWARRYTYRLMIFSVIVAFGIAEFIGEPVVYRWSSINNSIASAVTSAFARIAADGELVHTRIIKVDDSTLQSLSKANRLPAPVTPNNLEPLRDVYGQLMNRLSLTKVKSITYDLDFSKESTEFDESFVTGVRALQSKGVDVVVASPAWPLGRDPEPALSRNIRPFVKWGGVSTGFCEIVWPLDLVLQRGFLEPAPSLVLATVGAFFQPGCEMKLRLDQPDTNLTIQYFRRDLQDARIQHYEHRTDTIDLTAVERLTSDDADTSLNISAGDLVGIQQVDLRSTESLSASTMDLATALTCPEHQLADFVVGRAVLVGTTFPKRDVFDTPDGRELHGVYGHALAVEAIVGGHGIAMFERIELSRLSIVVSALVGTAMAWFGRGWSFLTVLGAVLGFALAYFVVSGAIYRSSQYLINPVLPMVALTIAFALGRTILRASSHGKALEQ